MGRARTDLRWSMLFSLGKWLFLAAVRNAPRRSRDVINLAATDHFLDLARRTASVIHENALASGQGAIARFALENLRMGRSCQQEQRSGDDQNAKLCPWDRSYDRNRRFSSPEEFCIVCPSDCAREPHMNVG